MIRSSVAIFFFLPPHLYTPEKTRLGAGFSSFRVKIMLMLPAAR